MISDIDEGNDWGVLPIMISTNGDGWTMVVVMIMTMVMIKIDENDPIWQENEPEMKILKDFP